MFYFLTGVANQKRNESKPIAHRIMNSQNLENLNCSLSNKNWDFILNEKNHSRAADLLTTEMNEELDKTCPKKSSPSQPWFSSGLRVSSKTKYKLFKKSLKKPSLKPRYRIYRNVYNKLIRTAKESYYNQLLQQTVGDTKRTWTIIREVILKTKNKAIVPDRLNLVQNDAFILQLEDPALIADYLNNYFAATGSLTSELANQFSNNDPLDYMKDIYIMDSMFIPPLMKKKYLTLLCPSNPNLARDMMILITNLSNILLPLLLLL